MKNIGHYFGPFLTVLMQWQIVKDVEVLSKLHTLYDSQAKYFDLVFMEQNPVGFHTLLGTAGRQMCVQVSFIILNTLRG